MPISLHGKLALVTGATSNIGLAIARSLAEHGAEVVAHARSTEAVAAVAEELRGHAVTADLGQAADIRAMFETIEQRHGRLDVLVNSAAATSRTAFADIALDEWHRVLAVNATGPLLCMQRAADLMHAGGSIINITSSLAIRPNANRGIYAASKATLDALTRQAAIDLAPRGIRVNAIVSGQVGSPVGQRDLGRRSPTDPGIPLGRIGRPEEIGSVAAFLASDEASYMTNSFVTVDGGRMHTGK